MSRKKFALIDPIGSKAGMDSYDTGLLSGLYDLDVEGLLYTNFHWTKERENSFPFFSETIGHKFSDILLRPLRYLRVLRHAKRQGCASVILHVFHFNRMDEWVIRKVKEMEMQTILIVHDVESFIQKTNVSRLKLICENLADVIVVHNNYVFTELSELLTSSAKKKIHVIAHGSFIALAENGFSKMEARELLGWKPEQKVVLFFGMIKANKGLDVLLKAWTSVDPEAKLVIAGRLRRMPFAPYQKIIDEKLKDKEIELMIRQVSNSERDLLFRAADLIVLPYSKIYQSGVLLMAMSYGLPVIASNAPGFMEILSDEKNALLFEVGDHVQLAEKINRLCSDNQLRQNLSDHASKLLFEKHDWNKIATKFKELLS